MLENFPWMNKVLSFAALLALNLWPASLAAQSMPDARLAHSRQPALMTAQDPQSSQNKVVIETKLVSLNISVTDQFGRFVVGLEKDDFAVYDDGIQQEVAFFATDDSPISMAIVYDVSTSTSSHSQRLIALLRQFFENTQMADEFCVIAFNKQPQLVRDFTSVPEEIINRTVFIKPKGSTALFDATRMAIEKVRQGRHPKKVVLILSDGEENSSRYSGREIMNLIRESDVQIHAIGVIGQFGTGPGTLRYLTEPTGGQVYFPVNDLSAELTYERLALILRRQYALGYYPNNLTAGSKWHDVRLKLNAPEQLGRLKLGFKNGYWVTR
jgi:Ca-activated chloride channel family protein